MLLALTPILHKQLRMQGIYVGSRAMFEQMNEAIAKATLRPVVDRVFALGAGPRGLSIIWNLDRTSARS